MSSNSIYDIDTMANKLEAWSLRDDATALIQFVSQEGIYHDYLYKWRDSSTSFSDTLWRVKARIATRLRARIKDTDKFTLLELGFHDPFFKEALRDDKKFESDLRKEEDKEKYTIINIRMPDCGGVGISTKFRTEGLPEKSPDSPK